MIDLILLSGFLGAGKTTLLRQILTARHGLKTGVIVNEFGEINIDARLIRQLEGGRDIQISELSNGSIFCACIKDKFVDSLIEMSCRDIDALFIEASGLADPANIDDVLEGIKNNVLNPYNYRGSVCIIDGENFADLYEIFPAVRSQLEYSGTAIVNKADLIDENQIEDILEIVREVNPAANLYVTSYCRVDMKEIIGNLDKSPAKARETSNTYESRPATFILRGLKQLPYDQMEMFVHEVSKTAFRVKGFAVTDRGTFEVSTVGSNVKIELWDEPLSNTELVVISAVGFKMMSIITTAIDKYLKDYITI